MDKQELERAMLPFVGEVPLIVRVDGRYYELVDHGYAQNESGEGIVVLIAGERTHVRQIT